MTSFDASHQLCSVTLLGNLVAKPEIRYLANPILAVSEITLATTHRWKDAKTKSTKEWTSYHTIKVIGKLVEETLIHANKGDILLVSGYFANNKKAPIEIIHASSVEHFAKGFTQGLNQVTCSASIASEVQLVTTEYDKLLANFTAHISHHAYAEHTQSMQLHQVERPVQLWGKQAKFVAEHGKIGDHVIIEARISYGATSAKQQQLEASNVHLLKK